MTQLSDSARDRLFDAVRDALIAGVTYDNLREEVAQCWIEAHRQALKDAERDVADSRIRWYEI